MYDSETLRSSGGSGSLMKEKEDSALLLAAKETA